MHHPGKAAGVSNVLNKSSPNAMVGFLQTAWKPTRPDQLGQPRCRLFAAALRGLLSHFAQPSARIHRSFDKGAKSCTVGICGCRPQKWRPSMKRTTRYLEGRQMKLSITLSALLIAGFVAASTEQASAVVYCQYVSYPAGCIVRPGVVLRPRPVARAVVTPGVGAAGVGVRPGTPMNRGGPVNRAGRR